MRERFATMMKTPSVIPNIPSVSYPTCGIYPEKVTHFFTSLSDLLGGLGLNCVFVAHTPLHVTVVAIYIS